MNNFIVSESAAKRINRLNVGESKPQMLRVRVEGGGCNGMKYQVGLVDSKSSDDLVFTNDGASVVVDKISIDYLKDSELEYVEDLGNASFVIKNPNSKSSCGCGASFSL